MKTFNLIFLVLALIAMAVAQQGFRTAHVHPGYPQHREVNYDDPRSHPGYGNKAGRP